MRFWGLPTKVGFSYEQDPVASAFHLSCAALDMESDISDVTSVIIETKNPDKEVVICNLSVKHNILQTPLDLYFNKGEFLKIYVRGSANIYLTGYSMDDDENPTPHIIFSKVKRNSVKEKKVNFLKHQESSSEKSLEETCPKIKSVKVSDFSNKELVNLTKKEKKKLKKQESLNKDQKSKKEAARTKPKLELNLTDLLSKEELDENDDEDDDYVVSAEEEEEEIEEEEVEIEEQEEEEEVEEKHDHNDSEEIEEEEEEKDEWEDVEDEETGESDSEKETEENKENMDVSVVEEEEEEVIIESPSPTKKKRILTPPSSAGRTPMFRANKKMKKQEDASPTLQQSVKNKNSDRGVRSNIKDTDTHSELKAPQSETRKHIKKGGLLCEDITAGTGPEATIGKKVCVYYIGKLANGKVFDKVIAGSPFRFKLGSKEVIDAWEEGVKGMKVGGKRKLVAPPNMAYGKKGMPPRIPPNAFLTFEIELKSIN